jgi:hypothetical protein
MPTIQTMLREHDEGVLRALAQVWKVETKNKTDDTLRDDLDAALHDAEKAERVWDMLDDNERGALQLLLTNDDLRMNRKKFEFMYGELRNMGRGLIEREEPHKTPKTVTEALFYRGFISNTFANTKNGMQAIYYVPDDLVQSLPVHKTAYADIENEPAQSAAVMQLEESDLSGIEQADTTIVDDLTTLLAFLRIDSAPVTDSAFPPDVVDTLAPYLLTPGNLRMAFLLGVGVSAEIITTQEGNAYIKRSGLQKWLNLPRSGQVRALADSWLTSNLYYDLFHVPGLHPELEAGFPYNPLPGREALVNFLAQFVPEQGWWSIDEFIETVKATDPDFQRPGGDYDSWYIRNDEGDYLDGFESWDAIEGALLEFYLAGPMHWLGLTDVADDGARLTAYGRAFVGKSDWPNPPEATENITVQDDGTLIASRRVSRLDRFQVARFTTWDADPPPYRYRLNADGLQQGAAQGINNNHIAGFLQRHTDGQRLPEKVARLLDTWQSGATADVTVERLLVLRTTSPDVMNSIYENPALRRYLGARLGPMACAVRADQTDDLNDALGEMGIRVEFVQ